MCAQAPTMCAENPSDFMSKTAHMAHKNATTRVLKIACFKRDTYVQFCYYRILLAREMNYFLISN